LQNKVFCFQGRGAAYLRLRTKIVQIERIAKQKFFCFQGRGAAYLRVSKDNKIFVIIIGFVQFIAFLC